MSVRILVVDDEPRYLRLLEANLLTEGYEVITAMDGEEAVESFSANPVDLVLLDVMLPRMDGFATCQRIRQFSSVPIIMLTAKGEEQDRVRGLDVGADDYLVKPFSVMELLARVRAVLRRPGPRLKGETIAFGDVRLVVRGEPYSGSKGADIAVGDGQPLGAPLSSGGPVATRDSLTRSVRLNPIIARSPTLASNAPAVRGRVFSKVACTR